MRQFLESQKYFNFDFDASPKVVAAYRQNYEWIERCLEENYLIL